MCLRSQSGCRIKVALVSNKVLQNKCERIYNFSRLADMIIRGDTGYRKSILVVKGKQLEMDSCKLDF